ncbi:hypothetical protein F5Y03DRAFT_372684 [Xylaria venustula]|nr:hypothetical protein F5Y03DRAFT_372684 [Xylaria venustula]
MDAKKKTQVHKSRILREMRNQAEHPWSPPTSTGSHGTVTFTDEFSDFNAAPRSPLNIPSINTSAVARAFPEWWGPHESKSVKPRSPVNAGKENQKPQPQPEPEPELEQHEPASPQIANNDVSTTSSSTSNNGTVIRRDPAR